MKKKPLKSKIAKAFEMVTEKPISVAKSEDLTKIDEERKEEVVDVEVKTCLDTELA